MREWASSQRMPLANKAFPACPIPFCSERYLYTITGYGGLPSGVPAVDAHMASRLALREGHFPEVGDASLC